ncbi:NADH dehydrogenase FAD-containing subunit [Planomicrobium stackebrandtii]|uniref:NADH dehydrogenase FAD-containing subunit n=1 Tax=Planomicrobium stackebrandtii TaxID=253160 RepID=A0ABU0GPJ8_9BACL|nr:FAD-dependent oxidoreductase [Planomicrobium stackebrandtii]MDQ0427280.1 NADH dehydrogenase FAD-containing subunit [Planomicrobium stackebrandtii]
MKTLVLVGGGHAHLHCLEQLKDGLSEDWRVLLISPSPYQYYSGMFSGFTEGAYSLDDIRIDLKKLCRKVGAIFIEDSIAAVNAQNRELAGAEGQIYRYDLASFDIGSQSDVPETARNYVRSIKPNYHFPEQLMQTRESAHPVVVGGGASGVELAFSILAWRKQQGLPPNLALFSSTSLLAGQGRSASKKIEDIAARKNLTFFRDVSIQEIDEVSVTTSAGKSYPQSDVLWLTGPKSAELFSASSLPTDRDGFLLVNDTLQSVQWPEIFGAGDCITIDRYPELAKNGVYAVRQGPVLWKNLKNSLSNDKLQSFAPQKRYVSILSTGGGEAFLSYGAKHFHGAIAWKIKQRIDRKFMKRYKDLYE